jgi:hypothetical protein
MEWLKFIGPEWVGERGGEGCGEKSAERLIYNKNNKNIFGI